MKILLATPFFPPDRGGVPHHVSLLARELRRLGEEVAIFRRTGDEGGPQYSAGRSVWEGIPVHAVRYRWEGLRAFEDLYENEPMERALAAVLEAERPDVVHFHHLTGFGLGALAAARRAGAQVLLTLHDFWLGCPRSQRITRELDRCPTIDRTKCVPCLRALYGEWIPEGNEGIERLRRHDERLREALAGVDRLVTPSRFVADVYSEDTGIPRDRFTSIPVGLDPAPFEGIARRPADVFRIAYAGTLLPSKGAHVLLDALRHLPADRVRIDVHGEVVPWFEERDYFGALRSRVRPGDPIHFTGPYDPPELPALLADADALVVPSVWFEAYSITVREGWLAGLPVVASRLGGMEEAIEDGATGLLFPPGDSERLGRALHRLLDDPSLRARLASAPKRVATSSETARALLALYSEPKESRP